MESASAMLSLAQSGGGVRRPHDVGNLNSTGQLTAGNQRLQLDDRALSETHAVVSPNPHPPTLKPAAPDSQLAAADEYSVSQFIFIYISPCNCTDVTIRATGSQLFLVVQSPSAGSHL